MKKYQIIYADPPWAYNESGSGNRVVHSKYPTMQINEIKSLPIKDMSDDNCILFLWVTFPRLPEGLETISAWGFKYKGLAFNWVKTNKKSDSIFWGMGYWTRQNPEICLIGIKGKIPALSKNTHCVLMDKIDRHSKKPERVRDLIIKICGERPRVELFARQKTEGWDVYGNEVVSDIDLA
jgi:N6-adenosine-specific RNA methylase IME4